MADEMRCRFPCFIWIPSFFFKYDKRIHFPSFICYDMKICDFDSFKEIGLRRHCSRRYLNWSSLSLSLALWHLIESARQTFPISICSKFIKTAAQSANFKGNNCNRQRGQVEAVFFPPPKLSLGGTGRAVLRVQQIKEWKWMSTSWKIGIKYIFPDQI